MADAVHVAFEEARFELEVVRYRNPEARDAADRNWLDVVVRLEAEGGSSTWRIALQTTELAEWRADLAAFPSSGAAVVELEALEGMFSARVERLPSGSVKLRFSARSARGELTSALEASADASAIPRLVEGLGALLEDYPVLD